MPWYDFFPIFTILLVVIIVFLLPDQAEFHPPALQPVPIKLDSYPLPIATPDPATTTIRFTGDIMLGRHVETLMARAGNGPDFVTERLLLPGTPDFTVINFESAMTEPHRHTPNMTFQFSTASSNLEALLPLRVTHASLANNHATDYGPVGYELTKDSLSGLAIETFGHPTVVTASSSISYVMVGKQRIALIGIHTLFRKPTSAELENLFKAAKTESDYQIVYIHWGDEYLLTANQAQRQLATLLVSLGADLIIGHHPHVVQDIAVIEGVLVVYSLGNFIFDQYFSAHVMDGLVLDMHITDNSKTIELIPVTTRHAHSQPELMSQKEATVFLSALASRSDPQLRELIPMRGISLETLAIAP